jgi:hypothetical protein
MAYRSGDPGEVALVPPDVTAEDFIFTPSPTRGVVRAIDICQFHRETRRGRRIRSVLSR